MALTVTTRLALHQVCDGCIRPSGTPRFAVPSALLAWASCRMRRHRTCGWPPPA